MTAIDHILYGLLWLTFGAGHSILAGRWAKDRLRQLAGGGYRLFYNSFATFHVGLILYIGSQHVGANAMVFVWPNYAGAFLEIMRWLGVAVIAVALLHYDLGRFSGMTQAIASLRGRDFEKAEPLHTAGLHRYVRHPLYTGVYLYMWGSVADEFALATALWVSLYLVVGTHFEERRLVAEYGDEYRAYRSRVPSIFPVRGRAL